MSRILANTTGVVWLLWASLSHAVQRRPVTIDPFEEKALGILQTDRFSSGGNKNGQNATKCNNSASTLVNAKTHSMHVCVWTGEPRSDLQALRRQQIVRVGRPPHCTQLSSPSSFYYQILSRDHRDNNATNPRTMASQLFTTSLLS